MQVYVDTAWISHQVRLRLVKPSEFGRLY